MYNLSTYHKWLIIYHDPRFAFSLLKSFIRVVEERTLFLGIKLRFTSPIRVRLTFLLMFLSLVIQLLKIQCALKLRRNSMVSLWVERSILLDSVILLMPSLMKTLQPKKRLTINFLPIPRFVTLVLVLSPIPIYLDLRKTSVLAMETWDQHVSDSGCNLSKLMNPLKNLVFL